MANEEQLAILKQGVEVWNRWREHNPSVKIDLARAFLWGTILADVDLRGANLTEVNLGGANLRGADLRRAKLYNTNLSGAHLDFANLKQGKLGGTNLTAGNFRECNFSTAEMAYTIFGSLDLRKAVGLEKIIHTRPSRISTDTFALSGGQIPEVFLRGCGLSDWEIEMVKLYNPDLSNKERNKILYRMYDLQASQAIQITPLFISYSHNDNLFVDKVGSYLTQRGIRYWRDIHEMKSGRMEKQIDRAIRQNPTVLLVLSEHSLSSDWVEHEVHSARGLEKEMGRDVLCPVALDDSWKDSGWPKRIMEQILEYNILDFSEWKDDSKFSDMFRKLIDGLELFYKG